jgi:hypothetical protein
MGSNVMDNPDLGTSLLQHSWTFPTYRGVR